MKLMPWRKLILAIHAKGMPWGSIGRELGRADSSVRHFAYGDHDLQITFERGVRVLEIYAGLYPEDFLTNVVPLISRTLGRLMERRA